MCKHIKFDRNSWAPCGICMAEKHAAKADYYRAEIAKYTKEAEELEAQGKKATFARDEIRIYQSYLDRISAGNWAK